MAPRANWKGFLKIGEVTCHVGLYTAVSTSERIAFHTINRATGNRVKRIFADAETGKPVASEEQVKGYDLGEGEHVVLTPEEVAEAVPAGDKVLAVESFIGCGDIDEVYFDKPYYLAPADKAAAESFALIREGLRKKKAAGIARTVLFRRVRSLLIRAHGDGLIATTLNFDYEVRSAKEAFSDVAAVKIDAEMLDLARHIIATKKGKFDPSKFEDRYEAALADLVKAKLEGREIKPPPAPRETKVVDLMAALRESAGLAGKHGRKSAAKPRKTAKPQKTAAKSSSRAKTKAGARAPARKAS